MQKFLMLLALSLASFTTLSQAAVKTVTPDKLVWQEATNLPKGAMVAILMGDPSKKQAFVARIKVPAGYNFPVHAHPVAETDTVLSGTWYFGSGAILNPENITALTEGSVISIPAKTWHYGITKEETVIQVSGIGPWGMLYPRHKV